VMMPSVRQHQIASGEPARIAESTTGSGSPATARRGLRFSDESGRSAPLDILHPWRHLSEEDGSQISSVRENKTLANEKLPGWFLMWVIISLFFTNVQDYIAAGQYRSGEQPRSAKPAAAWHDPRVSRAAL